MRELDTLLTRYLELEYIGAGAGPRSMFERLLTLPDPEILALLTGQRVADDPLLGELLQRIRGSAGTAGR
jgi:succinate dehydrogenase flavin-adding protein (antitoxin of CptAB toxin-antitoxin module)